MSSKAEHEDEAPKPKRVSRPVKTMGAMLGGLMEASALQPLDVTKTRLQLAGGSATLPKVVGGMLREEGVLSLWKGYTPFATHLVIKYACRWGFNEFYRSLLADEDGRVSTVGGFVAGLGSGLTEAVLIVTPFEVIKTRLQQQKGLDKAKLKYKNPIQCATTMAREEGVSALWKGNVPTMLRQGINQLFLFGTYDGLKKAIFGLDREAPISPAQSLTIGVVAGALGPLCNNPVDVAKTRLMAQRTVPGQPLKYTGTLQTIWSVYREEGFRSLMRGCGMRIARVAPGMGITFTVVEKVTETFGTVEE